MQAPDPHAVRGPSGNAMDARIRFQGALQMLELDFAGLRLNSAAEVVALYDRVAERIAAR